MCVEDLPPVPNYAILCRDGCYLFHPKDELRARFDHERAGLVDDLTLQVETFEELLAEATEQRDRTAQDLETFKVLNRGLADRQSELIAAVDAGFSWSELIVAVLTGAAAGAVVTVAVAAAFAL